jgi:hypothetical protein
MISYKLKSKPKLLLLLKMQQRRLSGSGPISLELSRHRPESGATVVEVIRLKKEGYVILPRPYLF